MNFKCFLQQTVSAQHRYCSRVTSRSSSRGRKKWQGLDCTWLSTCSWCAAQPISTTSTVIISFARTLPPACVTYNHQMCTASPRAVAGAAQHLAEQKVCTLFYLVLSSYTWYLAKITFNTGLAVLCQPICDPECNLMSRLDALKHCINL